MGFFDPLSFAPKDQETFFEYRACEIKHGRVAMMAALGAVTQHFVRLPGFEKTNWGEEMPSGINAAFNTPGTFGLVVLTLIAGVLEFTLWSEDPKKEPGNFGDPLGLGQYTEERRATEGLSMFRTSSSKTCTPKFMGLTWFDHGLTCNVH